MTASEDIFVLRHFVESDGAAERGIECHVAVDQRFNDPATWGLIMADALRQVAKALVLAGHAQDEEATTESIARWLARELRQPTVGGRIR